MKRKDLAVVSFEVLFIASWILALLLCFPRAMVGPSAPYSPFCPVLEEYLGWLTLAAILITVVFLISWVSGDPSAREREAKRQIMMEPPHVLMSPESKTKSEDHQNDIESD